jgi:hypothetical protein
LTKQNQEDSKFGSMFEAHWNGALLRENRSFHKLKKMEKFQVDVLKRLEKVQTYRMV